MTAWTDLVRKVMKRDKISYTAALVRAKGEYRPTKTKATKGMKSKTMRGKLDFTTKKGMARDVAGKRIGGIPAFGQRD